MKKTKLSLIAGSTFAILSIILLTLFITIFSSNEIDNTRPSKQAEMKEIVLDWARLAPFPSEVEEFTIHTTGNSFTRTFEGSFISSPEAIEEWVKRSPGLQNAEVESLTDNRKRYKISPGGGASHAEVTIDYGTGTIDFIASWS